MSDDLQPCPQPSPCPPGIRRCIRICLEDEDLHLQESLPMSEVPTIPVIDYEWPNHRIRNIPHCQDEICGQRIQIITMQGHEIRMMDDPSEASNISLTTSDASQHLRLDEMNMMTWMTSKKHHFLMVDQGHATASAGLESARIKYIDPNDHKDKLNTSSYMLLQTEQKHNFWMADTPEYPRIHASTIKGHEVLMLDESPEHPKGKIQITTHDKLMQIVMDVDSGDILINNFNKNGTGGNTRMNSEKYTGSIRIYSVGDIELHAEKNIGLFANQDIRFGAPNGRIVHTWNNKTILDSPNEENPDTTPTAPQEVIQATFGVPLDSLRLNQDEYYTPAPIPDSASITDGGKNIKVEKYIDHYENYPVSIEEPVPGEIQETVLTDMVATSK